MFAVIVIIGVVAPLAGARIEIERTRKDTIKICVAPLAGARIEIYKGAAKL